MTVQSVPYIETADDRETRAMEEYVRAVAMLLAVADLVPAQRADLELQRERIRTRLLLQRGGVRVPKRS